MEDKLKTMHKFIMKHATNWALQNSSKIVNERHWGMACGMVHACYFLTGDESVYDEYYAMLGVF